MQFFKYFSVLLFAVITSIGFTGCTTTNTDTVVYLVRHAEKVTGENVGRNPDLTDAGKARAQLLAKMLADKNITRIHSSDYVRTRDTAKPLAELNGLEIEIYDPSDLEFLAAKIETAGGSHLVVGHSNTIPETVVALSGDGGAPIEEGKEYDRLYTVRISNMGKVNTDLSRFGNEFKPTE